MPRLLCPLAAFVLLVTTASAQSALMVGRVDGEFYVSPTGQYKLSVPVMTELGGKIVDTENVVTFSDDFNTHISIACFPQDAGQKWELETRGLRDYLLYFFTSFVLADFQKRFPESSIESARFLPDLLNGTMITFALLPGGSYFETKNSVSGAPPESPVVAKRGTLLFVRNAHIYVLSLELAERSTQRSTYQLTVEQENLSLSERLIALSSRLVFTENRARTP